MFEELTSNVVWNCLAVAENQQEVVWYICMAEMGQTHYRDGNHNASDINQRKYPDSKVHGANMGPIWGRQDPGGPQVGPMNFAIWISFIIAIWRN